MSETQTQEFREVLRAEQSPDVYDGPNCDGTRAQWSGYAEGDKDGGLMEDSVTLKAQHFPPGTVVSVNVPCCPECTQSFDLAYDHETGDIESCDCGFDWRQWVDHRYS